MDFNRWLENHHDLKSTFEIKKFADKLKDIVCLLIGCTRKELENPKFKEMELGEEWWYYKGEVGLYPYDTPYEANKKLPLVKLTPRLLLQLLGTQCGRQIIHPNLWVLSLFADYQGDIEKWKDITGYEGKYQISSFGRVKGLNRKIIYGNESKGEYHTKKETILKSTITGKYEMIKLEGNNSVTIHSLVADAFLPLIEGKNYINHIDQNSLNNFYKNLERCTQSENIISANKSGNGNIGEKQADSKLTEKDVVQIKKLLKTTIKQKVIAKMFNVGGTTISDIKYGRKWKHVGKELKTVPPILPQLPPNWIITDMRFPNELQAVKDRGGITIRVNRDILNEIPYQKAYRETHEHESETALDNAEFDYVIENDSNVEELTKQVKKILIKEEII